MPAPLWCFIHLQYMQPGEWPVFFGFTTFLCWNVIVSHPLLQCPCAAWPPPRLSLCVCSCVSMLAWPSGHATKSCDLDVPFYFSVKELKTVFVSMPKWKNSLLKSALKTGQAFQAVLIEISLKKCISNNMYCIKKQYSG